METFVDVNELHIARVIFFEMLSGEFIAMTGYGVYVYLSPVDIDHLFNKFLEHSVLMPVKTYTRQCVKNAVKLSVEKRLQNMSK